MNKKTRDMRKMVRFRICGEISGEAEVFAGKLQKVGGIEEKRHLDIPTSLPPSILIWSGWHKRAAYEMQQATGRFCLPQRGMCFVQPPLQGQYSLKRTNIKRKLNSLKKLIRRDDQSERHEKATAYAFLKAQGCTRSLWIPLQHKISTLDWWRGKILNLRHRLCFMSALLLHDTKN